MKIRLLRERSTMMHSKTGSVGIVMIVVAFIVICFLPVQLTMIKAITEQMNIGSIEEKIAIETMNSVCFLNREMLGSGILLYDVKNSEKYIRERLRSMPDMFKGIKFIGDPMILVESTGNTIDVSGEVWICSISGKTRRILCENSFVIEIPEDEK